MFVSSKTLWLMLLLTQSVTDPTPLFFFSFQIIQLRVTLDFEIMMTSDQVSPQLA